MREYLALLGWLGPWAAEDRAPRVDRSEIRVDRFKAWIYHPPRPRGAMLVCPGIHYAGPADPRLDRFNKILAAAGMVMLSPFLPAFTEMIITEQVIDDLEAALDALLSRTGRCGIFSVSFGSLPTLRVAARRDRINGVVVFGGYADFHETVRFCLSGEGRDPLNQPVVMMNLFPEAPPEVVAAWRRYVEATWGRPELKVRARYAPIAEEIGAALTGEARRLFRVGVGLEGDALEMCAPVLARGAPAFLDPRPHLAGIRCPVHLVHGLDDDVIPAAQTEHLRRALPASTPVRTYLTGLYGHTGRAGLSQLSGAAREAATLLGMLRAIVGVAR